MFAEIDRMALGWLGSPEYGLDDGQDGQKSMLEQGYPGNPSYLGDRRPLDGHVGRFQYSGPIDH